VPAAGPDGAARVTLVGKAGCHLCDQAEDVVARVAQDLGVRWEKTSVDDDQALFDRYWELVPVVLVDGELIASWRVSEADLRAALTR
jgi:hypothetical protein